MPLRTSAVSEAERQAIEAEWNTERSYSLSNLAGTRRNGLRFVKAVKTDEEWTKESRAGVSSNLTYKSKTSREIAEENARWYRELVSGSSGSTTREQSLSIVDDATLDTQVPVASTSKVTLDDFASQAGQANVKGDGSKTEPFTLDDEDDEDQKIAKQDHEALQTSTPIDKPVAITVQTDSRHRPQDSQPPGILKSAVEDSVYQDESDAPIDIHAIDLSLDTAVPETQDMYCLLCKIDVPAADVAGHRASILHQLSKTSSKDDKPLVPPTHYGVRSSNVGYSMLQRLGWTEDTGLGSSQTGRKAPLKASDKHDRKGLGVDSKRRLEQEEKEGKIVKRTKQAPQAAAKPLAKNRRELEKAKKREMQMFKEGLAYLNT